MYIETGEQSCRCTEKQENRAVECRCTEKQEILSYNDTESLRNIFVSIESLERYLASYRDTIN